MHSASAIKLRVDTSLEMFRRISEDQARRLNSKFEQLALATYIPTKITQIIEDMHKRNWDDENSSLLNPDAQYYSVLAYQEDENILSRKDLANLLIHKAARESYGTPDGKNPVRTITPADEEFKKLLTENLTLSQLTKEEIARRNVYAGIPLSPEKLAAFFAEIEKLPSWKQLFWVVKETVDLSKLDSSNNLADRFSLLGFTILGRPPGLAEKSLKSVEEITTIIAPVEIVEILNRIIFPKPVEMNLVVGFSSEKDIHTNGHKSQRDVGLPLSPEVEIPDKADTFDVNKSVFIWHDIYHTFITCAIGEHRELFAGLADAIDAFLKQKCARQEMKQIIDFKIRLIDMEFTKYQKLHAADPVIRNKHNAVKIFLSVLVKSLNQNINAPGTIEAIAKKNAPSLHIFQGLLDTICRYTLTHNKEIAAVALSKRVNLNSQCLTNNKARIKQMLDKTWRSVYQEQATLFGSTKPEIERRDVMNAFRSVAEKKSSHPVVTVSPMK